MRLVWRASSKPFLRKAPIRPPCEIIVPLALVLIHDAVFAEFDGRSASGAPNATKLRPSRSPRSFPGAARVFRSRRVGSPSFVSMGAARASRRKKPRARWSSFTPITIPAPPPLERLLDWLKAKASAPVFIVAATVIVVVWIAVNAALGRSALDPPPFPSLEIVLSSFAFLVTLLILATQRRADALAAHREQLILQLAFVSEQKTAKIVALLEELRRDSPQLRDRVDHVADEMTESVDPRAVSEACATRSMADSDTPSEACSHSIFAARPARFRPRRRSSAPP